MWVAKKKFILILLLTPAFSGCLPQTDKVEDTLHIPTSSSYATLQTSTLPTSMSATPYPDQIATLGVIQTQTMQAMEENCDGIPSSYYMFEDKHLFVSPNGDWQIAYCVDPKSGSPYTRLLQIHGEKAWNIPFRQSILPRTEIIDGVLRVEKWSEDGKYVYLDAYFCCLDGPGKLEFVNSYGLYQVNLETAEIKEMIPGSGYFAFSPDGRYLAGNNDSRNAVLIYGLKNDKTFVVPVTQGYAQTGMFSWSPDSQRIVFVGAFPEWENISPDFKQGGFSLLLLDIKTKTITTLIETDIRFLTPSLYKENDWATNDEIFLSDRDGLIYILNTQTGQMLLQPAPTLSP